MTKTGKGREVRKDKAGELWTRNSREGEDNVTERGMGKE